jgi:hypothetical protein
VSMASEAIAPPGLSSPSRAGASTNLATLFIELTPHGM